MTSLKAFLNAKDTDCFLYLENGEIYTKSDVEEILEQVFEEPSFSIQEYYETLVDFLKMFRKIKENRLKLPTSEQK
jgi:hypothetical protein